MEEIWKDIEVRDVMYKVSNLGRIKGVRGHILKTRINQDGYEVATLGLHGKNRYSTAIHIIVARAFLPYPDDGQKYEVNHKDCNRTNNRIDNLEWITHKDNIKYAYKHNTEAQYKARDGIRNGRAKLDDEQVIEIRRLFNEENKTIAEISKLFNTPNSTIGNIVHNKTWTHLL